MKKYMKLTLSILSAAALMFAACKQPTITTTVEKPKQNKQEQNAPVHEMCTVTFNLDGGTGLPEAELTKKVIKDTPVVKPTPNPVKNGFIFQYWAAEQNGAAAYAFSTKVTGDTTLWAVWKEPAAGTIEVKFDLAGGEGSIASQYITPGSKVSIPSVIPRKENAFFKYWSKDGSAIYDFNQAESEAVTLTAVYHDIASSQTRIYDIQGTAHTSPLADQKDPVTVPGVVTAITYNRNTPNGFYIQDQAGDGNTVTSDGIFVYCGKNFPANIAVGDIITLVGWVKEHTFGFETGEKDANGNPVLDDKGKPVKKPDLTATQISLKKGSIEIIQKASELPNAKMLLPEPVVLRALDFVGKPVSTEAIGSLEPDREAIDFYESLESMRVKIVDPIVVAPYDGKYNGNIYYLAPGDTPSDCLSYRGGMMYNSYHATPLINVQGKKCFAEAKDAGFDGKSPPGVGSSYNGDVIGIIDFETAKFVSRYRVIVTEKLPELAIKKELTPEVSQIEFNEDCLNVVSYNLKNFSAWNQGQDIKEYSKPPVKSTKLTTKDAERAVDFADHFINQLKAPDVIALIEVQSDSGLEDNAVVSSAKTLDLLLSEIRNISAAPPYEKLWINPENNTDGGAPGANIRCAYLYRTDRVELVPDADGTPTTPEEHDAAAVIEASGVRLQKNPARIGLGSNAFERTRKSLVAHFKLKTGAMAERDFFIINNHLSSKRGDARMWGPDQPVVRKSEPKRHEQAQVVKDFIDSILRKRSDAVVVAVGDYNDFWFSKTMQIMKGSNLKNAVEEAPLNERYTFVYNSHSQTLDNILVPHHVSVEKIDVLNLNAETTGLSDHDPVFVQLSW
ncbi:MAG: InlB B-repeat-containing protein [Treponema sp.]